MGKSTDSPTAGAERGNAALTFDDLRAINKLRCETAFHQVDEWKPWEWSNAMAGECGEACNLTKKMNRIWPANQFKQNWNKPEDQRLDELAARVASEVADTVIYADLLLTSMGRSLGEAVRATFNAKSDEIGSPIKLPPSPNAVGLSAEPPIVPTRENP